MLRRLSSSGTGCSLPSWMLAANASAMRPYWSQVGISIVSRYLQAEIGAVVEVEAAGAVGRGVEGDFDLEAALGADQLHGLAGGELGGVGEDRLHAREVEEDGAQAVDAELGVALDECRDAAGLRPVMKREVVIG